MKAFLPYLKILRLQNTLLAGIAVALGFWLGHSPLPATALALLIIATVSATGFGNVINDLKDIATDRISHPERPLPRGEITPQSAGFYAWFLALLALSCASYVSLTHLAATAVPLILLFIYARFLKGTPLAGNVIVSLLVAYALLFGGMQSPRFGHLIIPAVLAFLLNLSREIIKDLQDKPGDIAAGIKTTAIVPLPAIKTIIFFICQLSLVLLFLPFVLHHFGMLYVALCAILVLPLQAVWLLLFFRDNPRLSTISLLIKIEMAAGLLAIAADKVF